MSTSQWIILFCLVSCFYSGFILFFPEQISLSNNFHQKENTTIPAFLPSDTFQKPANREQIKACVVYLAIFNRGDEEKYISMLQNALTQYEANFSNPLGYKYPAMIVHDGWITNEKKAQFYGFAPKSTIYFTNVDLNDTSYQIRKPEFYEKTGECDSFGHMYRLMNRVFVRLLFYNEIFKKFDYWLRIDLDITIIKEVKIDPFKMMLDGKYDFGYMQCFSSPFCTKGYYESVENYIRRKNIKVKDPWFWAWLKKNQAVFHGNFGIGRVSLFTSNDYLKLAEHIDEDGGIMRNRWDDQHTYAVAIALFSSYNRVLAFNATDITLLHKKSPLVTKICPYSLL